MRGLGGGSRHTAVCEGVPTAANPLRRHSTAVPFFIFFSSRRRHTRYWRDWSSDVCSSDLPRGAGGRGFCGGPAGARRGRTDRKSTRLKSSHANNSYAVFCLKKKKHW